MAVKNILLGAFFFFLQFCLIFAEDKPCGNHDIKVEYFRNCAEQKNSNIKIQNLTYTITDDCKLIPRGCFKVKKPISAAQVEYYINKPPFKKKGTEDFCEMLESPEAQKGFENYKSMPRKCTVGAGDYCFKSGSSTINELNPKTLNLLSGTTTGYFKIDGEGGQDKSCVEFKLVVTKKG